MRSSMKLFSAIMLMLISLSMMSFVSFAWFTLSTAPEISGIKVAISGDNTIMIAPNIQMTLDDGTSVHYPGYFQKTAQLEPVEDTLLSPVSTADGINWFIPNGTEADVVSGELDVSRYFVHETDYASANSKAGGYAYIDFWVVSPLSGTILRLCSGDPMSADSPVVGSYVVQLPESVKNFTNATGYNLDHSYQNLSSSIRVGFLVDEEKVTSDAVMKAYVDSAVYNESYKSIKGVYDSQSMTSFLIYEPNALVHPNDGVSNVLTHRGIENFLCEDGEYWATYPIGITESGEIGLTTVQDRLVIQGASEWKKSDDTLMIESMYQAYLADRQNKGEEYSLDDFYQNFMQGNYLQYVDYDKDSLFYEDSWDVLNLGDTQVTDAETMTLLDANRTNAVQDSYIVLLEKNVPQRIRMFVWIEGQDVDCSFSAAGQSLAIRLELSGSTGA